MPLTLDKPNTPYATYITRLIEQTPAGVPIFTEEITQLLSNQFALKTDQARKIVNTNLHRLKGTQLENFRKGIYYKPKVTVFGRAPLNQNEIIVKKYITQKNEVIGYETGPSFLQKIGLTTQIPKHRYIATNVVNHKGNRIDKELKIVLRKPKIAVTNDNVKYLQIIDAAENKDRASIDATNPMQILNDYIVKNGLDFGKLVAIAKTRYPKEVLTRVIEIAEATRL